MAKLKIDNIECNVPDGTTILEAAKRTGINIPVLCHLEGLPHYSSCMVCLVIDKRTKGYVPSCSALVQEGMDIDASGLEVVDIRKKAALLLLSEHRAECDAPCRIVCPAGYNIPLINRLLADGDIENAINLSASEIKANNIACLNCPGYCENACRRKKIDLPVSIRNIHLFIAQKIRTNDDLFPISGTQEVHIPGNKVHRIKPEPKTKRFSSHIGKLENDELREWLKECRTDEIRAREIVDNNSAFSEANSCMHCDCRAADDCRLRDLADELGLKDPRGKLINAPAIKKINNQTNLIFENAKCIKCGLCVRVCVDNNDDPPLCFINRGFISIISEPLTSEFVETMRSTADKCIEVCPTGALAHYKLFAK